LDQLPYYNPDLDTLEMNLPVAQNFREAVQAAAGLLVVTPEYNGATSSVLKNAIDWASRPYQASALLKKPVAVVSSSLSSNGGRWANESTRKVLEIASARVLETTEIIVGNVHKLFDSTHEEERQQLIEQLVVMLQALREASE
jgi:NAD(P)H-dependent FMN reductase